MYAELKRQPKQRFAERVAARYVCQTAEALRYMHSKDVMHRDIKPENILLGLHKEVKLADFGYSVHSTSGLQSTICGTADYLAPELATMFLTAERGHNYTKAVDRWSLVILAYELVVGKPSFEMISTQTMEEKIAEFKGKVEFPRHISKKAKDFIMQVSMALSHLVVGYHEGLLITVQLLTVDAEKRMSLGNALEHPWIKEHVERSRLSGLPSFE